MDTTKELNKYKEFEKLCKERDQTISELKTSIDQMNKEIEDQKQTITYIFSLVLET